MKRQFKLKLPGFTWCFYAENLTQAEEIVTECIEDKCSHPDYVQGDCKDCGFQCPHTEFKDGDCVECGIECDHSDVEENCCLDCGETVQAFDDDYAYDCWKDSQSEREAS